MEFFIQLGKKHLKKTFDNFMFNLTLNEHENAPVIDSG